MELENIVANTVYVKARRGTFACEGPNWGGDRIRTKKKNRQQLASQERTKVAAKSGRKFSNSLTSPNAPP